MRVLVDGVALGERAPRRLARWWDLLLPELARALSPHELLLLNRTPRPRFVSDGIVNLHAPAYDRCCPATEDRRLAALCREVGADRFCSTLRSSAGSQVATLMVVPPFRAGLASWPHDAVLMACGYVVCSPAQERRLARLGISTADELRRAFPSRGQGWDRPEEVQALARTVAGALAALDGGRDAGAQARRRRAEARVSALANAERAQVAARLFADAAPPAPGLAGRAAAILRSLLARPYRLARRAARPAGGPARLDER